FQKAHPFSRACQVPNMQYIDLSHEDELGRVSRMKHITAPRGMYATHDIPAAPPAWDLWRFGLVSGSISRPPHEPFTRNRAGNRVVQLLSHAHPLPDLGRAAPPISTATHPFPRSGTPAIPR